MPLGMSVVQFPFLVEPHLTIAHAAPPPTLHLLSARVVAGRVNTAIQTTLNEYGAAGRELIVLSMGDLTASRMVHKK